MNFQFRYKYIEINFNENPNPITLAKYFGCHGVVSALRDPHATATTSNINAKLNREHERSMAGAAVADIVCSLSLSHTFSLSLFFSLSSS